MPEFDFRRFLVDHFTTPEQLQALMNAYGFDAPALSAAQKWFARESIPSHALPAVLLVAEMERGKRVEIARYFKNKGARK